MWLSKQRNFKCSSCPPYFRFLFTYKNSYSFPSAKTICFFTFFPVRLRRPLRTANFSKRVNNLDERIVWGVRCFVKFHHNTMGHNVNGIKYDEMTRWAEESSSTLLNIIVYYYFHIYKTSFMSFSFWLLNNIHAPIHILPLSERRQLRERIELTWLEMISRLRPAPKMTWDIYHRMRNRAPHTFSVCHF